MIRRAGGISLPVLSVLSLAAVSLTAAGLPAHPARAAGPAGPAEQVSSYAMAIREHVMIQTPVDTDRDGRPDRVGADIIRPRESSAARRVPVILDVSPYYDNLGRGNESERKAYDAAGTPTRFPLFYDNYFVPKGYAVVLADMTGTNRSEGCPTTGGAGDVLGAKAVVDWLNGRVAGFRPDGSEVAASWSTGAVGMIGKSYDGTLPNAVAATGVEGLRTIVPISAISSWYDYYRMNGVVFNRNGATNLANTVDTDPDATCAAVRDGIRAGADDASGNRNAFWSERDYLAGPVASAEKVRASVFVVHGLNDLNVKTTQFAQWWRALGGQGVPRKMWLSQRGHVDPFDFRRSAWVSTLRRWFDFWLKGIDNGIMREPAVDLEVAPDTWVTQSSWPAPGARPADLHFTPGPAEGLGGLSTEPGAGGQVMGFTDDPTQTEAVMAADPEVARPNRLVFLSPPLRASLRVSGLPRVRLTAALDRQDVNFTALLVDYGTATRVDARSSGEGIVTRSDEQCFGQSSATDNGCYRVTQTTTRVADVAIVAAGWLDAHNRSSLDTPEQLVPGQDYEFTWQTLPQDYQFRAGHRVGVVIAGTDRGRTVADQPAPASVDVQLDVSGITLPVVGGPAAVRF